jgi:hypothetical protein
MVPLVSTSMSSTAVKARPSAEGTGAKRRPSSRKTPRTVPAQILPDKSKAMETTGVFGGNPSFDE